MKISVVCMGRGSTSRPVNGGSVIFHYVDFGVKKEKKGTEQKFIGQLHFESAEIFHYKVNTEYTLDLSECITLASLNETSKVNNGYGETKYPIN